MATDIVRRLRPGGPQRSSDAVARARTLLDRVTDRLSLGAISDQLARFQRLLGLTRSGYIAVVGAVMLWIIARVVAGTAMYLASYGAIGFVIAAVFLAPKRLGMTAERAGLFPRTHEGQVLDVTLKLKAKRTVSTFLLEERVPESLGTTARVPVVRLAANQEVEHRYNLRCQRRGVYKIGPLVAVAADPLGLSRRERVIAEPFELLVHPRVEIVRDRPLTRQFEDPPIRPPVSKPWPSGLEFYGMREYAPGDDLRRIVWRATARTGKVMVREAEQGITDRITLIVDTDRGSHSHEAPGYSESFEAAARVAASLGVRHLREGYEVRCETNGGPLTRPLRGAGSQLLLLDGLARMQMVRDQLSKALMRLIANPRRDAHNVLITPKLTQEQAAQLRLLLNTGVSVLIVALLWDEEDSETLATAASLGCQVAAVHPGEDLATALSAELGAGTR